MSNTDGRRPRYVPVDALVAFSPFGTRLLEKWGMEGLCAWMLLLAAAKREPLQGTFTYTSEAEAWTKLGAEASGFTFETFITFCGRNKQTRKTRSGRTEYVQITGWKRWNDTWKTQQDSERKTSKQPQSNATKTLPRRDQYATEAEVESELEAEPNGLLSIDKKLELQRLLQSVRGADDRSWRVVEEAARGVTLAGIVRVRESCDRKRPRPGVGYAVNALKSEAKAAAA